MDAGVLAPGEAPVTAAALLADPAVCLRGDGVNDAARVAAMDDLWAAQATALSGTALVHSLFLWPQLHTPDAIADPAVRAFAVGVLVSTAMMRRVIEQAGVYRVRSSMALGWPSVEPTLRAGDDGRGQEEDYVLENMTALPSLKVRTEDEAALLLAQEVRHAAAAAAADGGRAAVHVRLAAMASLLRVLTLLRPASEDPTWAKAAAEVAIWRGYVEQAAATRALGDGVTTAGYHPALVRALVGSAPPRLLPRLPRADGHAFWLAMASDLAAVCTMTSATTWFELTVGAAFARARCRRTATRAHVRVHVGRP
jgi:hypothetical protein